MLFPAISCEVLAQKARLLLVVWLQQLFEKTGVRTRGQLVRIAIERSLETARTR